MSTGRRKSKRSLSRVQNGRNDDFLKLFVKIEMLLKGRLNRMADDHTGVTQLIKQYNEANPLWSEHAKELRQLKNIRNILVHYRSQDGAYPFAVSPRSLDTIHDIHERLASPVPISSVCGKNVTTIAPDSPLSEVLTRAYKNAFSQFPVISNGCFRGMLTENAITRWLGNCAQRGITQPDMAGIKVLEVLREEEKNYRGRIFRFVRSDRPVDEVMALFALHPMLEVVLLTGTGRSGTEPLQGIVTEWDAARFSKPQGRKTATNVPNVMEP
jgi:predicted transcriptional regulator